MTRIPENIQKYYNHYEILVVDNYENTIAITVGQGEKYRTDTWRYDAVLEIYTLFSVGEWQ